MRKKQIYLKKCLRIFARDVNTVSCCPMEFSENFTNADGPVISIYLGEDEKEHHVAQDGGDPANDGAAA